MTDERMRIKVAEACGTAFKELVIQYPDGRENGRGNTPEYIRQKFNNYRSQGIDCELVEVTSTNEDYPNDLQACHEMEKALTEKQVRSYAFILAQVLDTSPTVDLDDQFLNIHATARQRCEAFLKTLGLWEDEK